jgi:hypothetical protein
MRRSNSEYIAWESLPLKELFKQAPGSLGLYIPVVDSDGNAQASIIRISSSAKGAATRHGKRCGISTLLVLKNEQGLELPTPSKMVQIIVKSPEDLSPQGRRYTEANRKTGTPA